MKTLVIMAAGMGSRFGAPKQLTPVGPHDETILDYNTHDGVTAGFGRIVVVTRPELEEQVQAGLAAGCGPRVETHVVLQTIPEGRTKPLGSAEAVLTAAGHVDGFFGVANADDLYGPGAFRALSDWTPPDGQTAVVVAYPLAETVPASGRVTRALLEVEGLVVTDVAETPGIGHEGEGLTVAGGGRDLTGQERVSMNLWGLPGWVMDRVREQVDSFRRSAGTTDEIYLPELLGGLSRSGSLKVQWVPSGERWAGVTNPDDLGTIREFLKAARPEPLWT